MNNAKAKPAKFARVRTVKNISVNKDDLNLNDNVICQKTIYIKEKNKLNPYYEKAKKDEIIKHDNGAVTVRYDNRVNGTIEEPAIHAADCYGTVKVMKGCEVSMSIDIARHFQNSRAIEVLL